MTVNFFDVDLQYDKKITNMVIFHSSKALEFVTDLSYTVSDTMLSALVYLGLYEIFPVLRNYKPSPRGYIIDTN